MLFLDIVDSYSLVNNRGGICEGVAKVFLMYNFSSKLDSKLTYSSNRA